MRASRLSLAATRLCEPCARAQPSRSITRCPSATSDRVSVVISRETTRMAVERIVPTQSLREDLVARGVVIRGPSGSGKSPLMNLIGCLDTPSRGSYWLAGRLASQLDDDELAAIRN